MVNDEYRFVFVHIPKCGGLSVSGYFNYEHKDYPHKWASVYERDYPEYYYWTVVRNTWDRMVSSYHYDRLYEKMTFKEFCLDLLDPEGSKSSPSKEGFLNWTGVHGQLHYCFGLHGYWKMDFYCNFARFREDIYKVFDIIGIPKVELPHNNLSKHKDYRYYYDNECIEACYRRYKAEINHFGFEFDNPLSCSSFIGEDLSGII